jgi:hypothetical protein
MLALRLLSSHIDIEQDHSFMSWWVVSNIADWTVKFAKESAGR